MVGLTISKGTISVHSFPLFEQGDAYRCCCEDFSVLIFLKTIDRLRPYFDDATESWGKRRGRQDGRRENNNVYMPCMVEKRVHKELSYHSGRLLCPPNLRSRANLLAEGMIIPDLELYEVYRKNGQILGYVMNSAYAGDMRFFVSPPEQEVKDGPRYMGMVRWTNENNKRFPVARINMSSENNDDLFRSNAEELEAIISSPLHFWWELENL